MKYVAVEGMTLSFGDNEVGSVELGSPSEKVLVDGKGVYAGQVTISLSDVANATVHGVEGSGNGVFVPSSLKCDADGEALLLEGDKAYVSVMGKNSETGVDLPWVVMVEIVSAGQNSVSAE